MKRRLTLFLLALGLLSAAPHASAVDLGVRGGYYFDAWDPFLGVEVITPIGRHIFFNPNFEYVFASEDLTHLTFNFDFHYDFPTTGSTFVWAAPVSALSYIDPRGGGQRRHRSHAEPPGRRRLPHETA